MAQKSRPRRPLRERAAEAEVRAVVAGLERVELDHANLAAEHLQTTADRQSRLARRDMCGDCSIQSRFPQPREVRGHVL